MKLVTTCIRKRIQVQHLDLLDDVVNLEFITVSFLLTFTFGGFDTNFLVILLEGGKILTSLGELTFFHTLTDVPMDEGTLGVHQIELMIDSGEDFSDSGGVGDHAHSTHDLGQITTRDDGWWLVVDTALETGRRPIDELDGSLGLDGGNGSVDILRDDITTVHQAAGHVLTVTRITLDHHRGWLEDGVGDLSDGELFVVSLLSGDDRSIGCQHKVDTWVWHQVGLELSDIDVQRTVETEGSGQGGDNLSNQSVQVGVGRTLDIQVTTADIVESLVIDLVGDIGVFQERVDTQDGVVRFDNGGSDLRAAPDGEGDLGLLTVIDGKTFHHQATETGTGTTTDGVVDEESLETGTVISQLSDTIQAQVDNFLTDGVVTTSKVVGGIFLTGDQLFRVEQLTVGSGTNFIDDGRFQIDEDASRDVLSGTSLGKEGVEGIITTTDGLIGRHLTIRLDTVFQTEQLPAGITDLDTGLPDVNADGFSHFVSLRG